MEDYIKELIETACTGYQIVILDKPIPEQGNNYPCITFHFFNEIGAKFGKGKATEEQASCQIDIWYKVKNDKVKNVIKNIKSRLINEKYFTYPERDSMYESDTKIFHTYYSFNLIKESED